MQECVTIFPLQIMKSLEVGYWVDEEPYELSDAFPAAQVKICDSLTVIVGLRSLRTRLPHFLKIPGPFMLGIITFGT